MDEYVIVCSWYNTMNVILFSSQIGVSANIIYNLFLINNYVSVFWLKGILTYLFYWWLYWWWWEHVSWGISCCGRTTKTSQNFEVMKKVSYINHRIMIVLIACMVCRWAMLDLHQCIVICYMEIGLQDRIIFA